jgi:hypothetical protein
MLLSGQIFTELHVDYFVNYDPIEKMGQPNVTYNKLLLNWKISINRS